MGSRTSNPTIRANWKITPPFAHITITSKTPQLEFSDTEADVFSYSFPGKGGKFVLSQGGQPPYLIPYEPIRITPEFVQSPNMFPKFEIVDENGTLHRFGKNESGVTATESTSADNGGLLTTSVTAWHLMVEVPWTLTTSFR